MQEDKRDLPVRRRDCSRETRKKGGEGDEFRCQSDDHDEVEVMFEIFVHISWMSKTFFLRALTVGVRRWGVMEKGD